MKRRRATFDLRALSFRFVFNPPHNPKSSEDLKVYATAGSGTVNGKKDDRVGVEIDFLGNLRRRRYLQKKWPKQQLRNFGLSSMNWTSCKKIRNIRTLKV